MGDGFGGNGQGRHTRPDLGGSASPTTGSAGSGRRFVIGSALGLAVVVAALALSFALWRAENRARADLGARSVAPMLDPLAGAGPPGVSAEEWAAVVAEARRQVETLAASGALNRAGLAALADELRDRVAHALAESETDPAATARALAGIWTDLEDRAGPILTRAPRFQLASALGTLARLDRPPLGIEPDEWALAILRARAAFAAAADPSRGPSAERRALRDTLAVRLAAPRPETAASDLAVAWRIVGDRVPRPFPPSAPPSAERPGADGPGALGP